MAINFARFVIIASLICGSITYITCSDEGEYYELPTVVRNSLPDAQKNQVILWTSTIMENKTISDVDVADSLTAHLKTSYAGNWIGIVGLPNYSSSVKADNVKILVLNYHSKKIVLWNSAC